jgi:hypothetical protein
MGSNVLAAIITSGIVTIGGLLKIMFMLGSVLGRLERVERWVDTHDTTR